MAEKLSGSDNAVDVHDQVSSCCHVVLARLSLESLRHVLSRSPALFCVHLREPPIDLAMLLAVR